MPGLLLGVDVGTSSSKACLVDGTGQVLRTAERAHATESPRPGWVEHDAEHVWWADVVALSRELVEPSVALDGVCVSGIGPCLLVTDEDDRPLRPAILYGVDTRAQEEIDELTQRLGAERVLAQGGSPLTSQAVGPKMLWVRRHEPDVWRRARRFYMASSFAVRRLTGAYVLDHQSASQCSPLYDLRSFSWDSIQAQDLAAGLELPPLRWPAEPAGTVTRAASAETGIPAGTPVMTGTIDAWSEGLSVGVREPGDQMLMYGTTMFFIRVQPTFRPDPGMWTTAGVRPGSRTTAGGMATSGALTSWFRALLGGPSFEELLRDAGAAPAGSGGLVVLPYFAGERTPLFDPLARGVIAGLHLGSDRGHLYRALLEATAYGARHNLEVMARISGPPARVAAVGGGTRGRLWTQIVSDVTGYPQEVHRSSIGASYGDAILAAIGCGVTGWDSDWNPIESVVEPRPEHRETYDRLYQVYRRLYAGTLDPVHALARLQQDSADPASPG